jgi:predicted GH43/DUF377 family glycosyl hydrolase
MPIQRYNKNPIITPNSMYFWRAEATFNGCPVKKGKKTYIVYRALSLPHFHSLTQQRMRVSNIGVAESFDGINFSNHQHFIFPEYPWEKFGCEDPRVTKLNEKYYIFYTALSEYPPRADGIKVALAISNDMETINQKHLVTTFNSKAMALFPEKIEGKIWAILTVHTDRPPAKICLASFEKESDLWSEQYWQEWYATFASFALPLQRRPEDHIEVGAPPLKTSEGWLIIYSYIKNYFSPDRLFGVEAVLLDLKNPLKIIGRTGAPLFTPEEYYEKMGMVANVIFPSGALIENNIIYLYYGAADTTCCLAYIKLECLLSRMMKKNKKNIKFQRQKENPIITPSPEHSWESKATFNPGAISLEGKVHLIYRAMSNDNTSVLGYANTRDGIHLDYRSPNSVYVPREPFEQKLVPKGHSGCEDPRLTQIDDKIYMFYTAFDGKDLPRIAVTWILVKDFTQQVWNWAKPMVISSPDFANKDACIFPEKIGGNYLIIHRYNEDIDFSVSSNLDFDGQSWLEEYRWIAPRRGMWDDKKIGIAGPPFKTKQGWIFFYHGVSSEDGFYRVGACLVDLKNPMTILARLDNPILEPETDYEKKGIVPNVVFPCGSVILGETVFMYYGGADKVVGVATISVNDLLKSLELCKY